MARVRSRDVRCSFCGRPRDQVSRIIAGPGVYICDRCVVLCNEVLAAPGPKSGPPAAPARPRRPDLPLVFRSWLRNLFRSAAPSSG